MKITIITIFILASLMEVGLAESISLDWLLMDLQEKHPLIKQESLSPKISDKGRERYLTAQDWFLSGGPVYFHSKPIVTSPFSATTIDRFSHEVYLQRKFWSSGGSLMLGWSSIYTKQSLNDLFIPTETGSFAIPSGFSTLYEHTLSAGYTQPLLRNFKGKLDRLEYELADYDVTASELKALENQERFLYDIGSKYLDWVLLEERGIIAAERLGLAEEILELTQAKREANLVDEVDVLRAEDAVYAARQNHVLIKAQIKATKAELAVLAQADQINQSTPEYDIYGLVSLPRLQEAYDIVKQNSRILKALKTRKAQLLHLKTGFEETGRASLDLDLRVAFKGGEDDFGGSLEMTKPDLTVGLMYSQQLGSRSAKIDLAKTDLEILQLESQIKRTELDLESALHNILIQKVELERVMELNREEIESARLKTIEELKLYEQGRSDLTFVIQSRDNQENAKLILAENAANYHRLLLKYREISDQLLRQR